jgi:hypothetical protein
MWDHFAQEPVNAEGTPTEIYQRDLSSTKSDPLYSEPIVNSFIGPYVVLAQIEWPEFTPEAAEEGLRALWPSGIWIPRKSLEAVYARAPREGDIVRFWKLPYFDKRASRDQNVPGSGFYFDVIKCNDDGHIVDNAEFVGFRCDLKRRSNFTPETQLIKPPSDPNAPCP